MNKSLLKFTLLLPLLMLPASELSAYKFDFTTVGDIVKRVKKKFREIETYQADFRITTDKLGRKSQQSGIVKYKSNDKMAVEFYQPAGQRIVSNGKMMWLYIPSMNVVAEQDISTESGLFSSGSKSGLNRLFSKYHYRFASKDQPETVDGKKMYTMFLKQKESGSGFRTMKLWISEDYFIVRALGETSTGKNVEIAFSNIRTGIDIPNGQFKFDVPSKARVIKNPMVSEE